MASFAAGPPEGLEITEEMPVKVIANKVYEYWKECGGGNIKFIMYVLKHLKPILLTDGLPNKLYKNFLRHFTFTYLRYDKRFITSLFQTALEENAITGVIRIVANDHNCKLVKSKSGEKVFIDSSLLTELKELNNIIPLILKDGIRIYGRTQAKNAVISNSIINMLNAKRPDDNPLKRPHNINNSQPTKRLAWQAGTRKRHRKSKATRRRR